MATLKLEMALDNAAFEDSGEVARILRALADRIEVQVVDGEVTYNRGGDWPLVDVNGNRVGSAWIEADE